MIWIDFRHENRSELIESDKSLETMTFQGNLPGKLSAFHDKRVLITEGIFGIFKTLDDEFQNHRWSLNRTVV